MPVSIGNARLSISSLGATRPRAIPSFHSIRPSLPRRAPGARGPEPARARELASTLRRALERLERALGGGAAARAGARVRSASDLGLDPNGAPTTLGSTEEVNATPTSFGPFGPAFARGSTSLATVTGIYNGTADDVLTFSVTKGGTVGSADDLKIQVKDGGGGTLANIQIAPGTAPDTPFTLSNGLVLSFSSGTLVKQDTFTVNVSASIGSAVDPDKPFDGARSDYPNFEYGTTITAGAFDVNGAVIAVNADDTLSDVLARITASAADVTATFDAATETLRLARKTNGSAYGIVVGGDTSGFLAAAKLAGAVAVPGEDGDGDPDRPIATVAALSGIASGTLTVNGVGVAIDVGVDSLADVLARITASAAGVAALLDPDGQRLTLVSRERGAPIVLEDGDTNFFATLRIQTGTHDPPRRRLAAVDRVGNALEEVATALSALLRPAGDPALADAVAALRADLRGAIAGAFSTPGPRYRTAFGLRFDTRAGATTPVEFGPRGRQALARAAGEGDAVQEFFLKARERNGPAFLPALLERARAAEAELAGAEGSRGIVVDLLA